MDNVIKLVNKTVKVVSSRRRNVVVSSLTECLSHSGEINSFVHLCSRELNLKPKVLGTRRLGKSDGIRPRGLLVKLDSESSVQEVLRVAKKLRTSTDSNVARNVHVNPDLSKEDAKLAYEKR